MDVGPLVIPQAQAAKLTEPGKCALHDPAPPAQATPMLGAALGQHGHDVTRPETAPNGGCVVAAIPEHTVWPLSRSPRSPCSGERGQASEVLLDALSKGLATSTFHRTVTKTCPLKVAPARHLSYWRKLCPQVSPCCSRFGPHARWSGRVGTNAPRANHSNDSAHRPLWPGRWGSRDRSH